MGAVPDMFYGDHQFQVSDKFAHCQWWYRNEVAVPASYKGKRVWLNLDGINYKADIYVNGSLVGKMAGAFIRGRFDITNKVIFGMKNCIAVLIYPVANPCEATVKTLGKYDWPCGVPRNTPTFVDQRVGIGCRRFGIGTSASGITSPFRRAGMSQSTIRL